ncbi:MAG: nuclear transport factor 2 family protein [Pyrinomonadaceae bacterium]
MKIFAAITMLILVATVSAQNTGKNKKIEDAVLKVITDQAAAWNRGDLEGFMEGYWKSENLRFVSGNSIAKGWQAALDRYKKGYDTREKMGVLTFSELEVTVLDKKSAYVKGRFTLERKEDKPTGLFTLIFRKIDGEWKVVHDHTST